jgi:hypothetical protein
MRIGLCRRVRVVGTAAATVAVLAVGPVAAHAATPVRWKDAVAQRMTRASRLEMTSPVLAEAADGWRVAVWSQYRVLDDRTHVTVAVFATTRRPGARRWAPSRRIAAYGAATPLGAVPIGLHDVVVAFLGSGTRASVATPSRARWPAPTALSAANRAYLVASGDGFVDILVDEEAYPEEASTVLYATLPPGGTWHLRRVFQIGVGSPTSTVPSTTLGRLQRLPHGFAWRTLATPYPQGDTYRDATGLVVIAGSSVAVLPNGSTTWIHSPPPGTAAPGNAVVGRAADGRFVVVSVAHGHITAATWRPGMAAWTSPRRIAVDRWMRATHFGGAAAVVRGGRLVFVWWRCVVAGCARVAFETMGRSASGRWSQLRSIANGVGDPQWALRFSLDVVRGRRTLVLAWLDRRQPGVLAQPLRVARLGADGAWSTRGNRPRSMVAVFAEPAGAQIWRDGSATVAATVDRGRAGEAVLLTSSR